jgi:hypothetical protein
MRKFITLMITGLVLVLAAIAMAAGGTQTVVQVPSSISLNKPIVQRVGTATLYTFVGKVVAANGVGQKGRMVLLFDTNNKQLGTVITGAFPGHSAGYWNITEESRAIIAGHRFDAYTPGMYLGRKNPITGVVGTMGPWIDYQAAQSPQVS